MARKEAKRIFDLVDCIQGTYVKTLTEGVTADNPDIANPCRIEYIPDKPAGKGIRDFISFYLGKGSTVITNRVYPEEAILHETLSNEAEEGVPERVVAITEDQHRNRKWLNTLNQEIKESITEMAEELSAEKKGRMEQNIQNLEKKEESKADQKSSKSRKRNRGRDSPNSIEDLF